MKKMTLAVVALGGLIAFGGGNVTEAHCGNCGAHDATKASATKAAVDMKAEQANIVETAVAAGSFNTLVAAVKAAGLVEVLAGEGPYTVFAPTDEAFAKLPEGTVESLLKDKEALAAILTYHVVAGEVTAKDVVKLKSAESVNGADLTIKTNKDKVFVDNAQVVQADILCSNGVIHVIDEVMLPKN
jgi:uncharacterized surface protein with fasciclin (FAS1) repeats